MDNSKAHGNRAEQGANLGHPDDYYWMSRAIEYARIAADKGEVPVGALLVGSDGFLAGSGNGPITKQDPTAHAEILVLREAARRLNNYRLPSTTLYVTLEPCVMCMGALIHARIERLVYGAADPKTGAASSLYSIGSDGRLNHQIVIDGGILSEQCGALLKEFFRAKRHG
ncbi:MAG: tRNA adenosine(34) deaminase TadA [Desulforhopalus sp.]